MPADVIATVMVLQALEGLSDRDAAKALRTDIGWKVAAGLALDDEGIHYSVLTYWRKRLASPNARSGSSTRSGCCGRHRGVDGQEAAGVGLDAVG